MSKLYTADFETNNSETECRVWAWASCEIGNPENFKYGNTIEDFINWCSNPKENYTLYFHNLKFDSEFIFSYLLQNGFTVIKDKKERKSKTFTCLISDMNVIYSLEIYFEVGKKLNKVSIYDSLKILNFSVDKIAKDFKLPIRKLKIDYNEIRELNHELTSEEIDYIRNDVEIMARALDIVFKDGHTKMTIASDALADYKKEISSFDKYFPVFPYEIDMDMRESYKGGFTYLNPLYKEKETSCGIVFDVNSLYPSRMYYETLPFGEPIRFEGEYIPDKLYPLYIQTISVIFELKKGKIPTIQVKSSGSSFIPTEYLESSDGEIVTLKLTNVDLELFKSQYDIKYIKYDGGYKFKGIRGLFKSYIDKWIGVKIQSKKDGNGAMYTLAKLFLNSLYGKFGLNPNVQSKYPYLSEEGIVKYGFYEQEVRDPIYIPMASFITSYARRVTITASQKIRDYSIKKYGVDKYVYSDTDSIHCLFESDVDDKGNLILPNDSELYDIIDIDEYNLGAWKPESRFVRGKYIRAKSYIELGYDDKLNCTVAGLPKELNIHGEKTDIQKIVNFENFKTGTNYYGKLKPVHVKNGLMLVEDYFTIRSDKNDGRISRTSTRRNKRIRKQYDQEL